MLKWIFAPVSQTASRSPARYKHISCCHVLYPFWTDLSKMSYTYALIHHKSGSSNDLGDTHGFGLRHDDGYNRRGVGVGDWSFACCRLHHSLCPGDTYMLVGHGSMSDSRDRGPRMRSIGTHIEYDEVRKTTGIPYRALTPGRSAVVRGRCG
jgi:hypothetical protein